MTAPDETAPWSLAELVDQAGSELVPMVDLRPGDCLPYYVCACPCDDGPCEHGPEVWMVAAVSVETGPNDYRRDVFGDWRRPVVLFTNGRTERGASMGSERVRYVLDVTP